jgi:hypothetical protein
MTDQSTQRIGETVKTQPLRRFDWLTLVAILFLAAIMRLGESGIVEFRHDEAMLSLMTQDMLSGKGIPLTGIPSSVGVPNPPISVYILAIPYALSNSPLFATLFIAVLNVMGVGLLWWMARRYFGRMGAIIAGVAYAVNPWAILYSRKIWAQDFHTPLFLLAIWLGLYGFIEGKRWAQVLCLPLLLIALQIHFAAWALFPLYFWFLWAGRRKFSWKAFALSVFLGILTLLPFLGGLSQTLEQDPNRISNALGSQDSSLSLSISALHDVANLTVGLGVETQVAPNQVGDLLAVAPRLDGLWLIVGPLALVGIVSLIVGKHRLSIFVMLWAGLPLLIFTPTWTVVYPHYFIASIPAFCLLIGLGAVFLLERRPDKRLIQIPVLALLGVIFVSQGLWWRGMLHFVDTTYTPDGFGTPLHYIRDVREKLADQEQVIVVSSGSDVLYDQEAAAWPVLLKGSAQCIRALDGQGAGVLPVESFAVLTAPDAPDNAVFNLYHRDDSITFPLRPGEGEYTVGIFADAPEWPAPSLTPIPPARFGSGIELTGYRLDPTTLYLEWRMPGQVAADYHYFGHFLDANGEKLGQSDSVLLPGRSWCKDDRLATWAFIDLPADVTTLRVGLYTLQGGRFVNDSLLDADENPVSAWIDIALPSR